MNDWIVDSIKEEIEAEVLRVKNLNDMAANLKDTYKGISETDDKFEVKYHEQIANWLEELVMLRLDSCMIHMPERLHLVENGYNKALNDFVNACEKQFTTMYGQRYVDMRDIKNIAEKLKTGGENEL